MKKNPSMLKACRVTTQKFLYFLTFLASSLRGAYFAAPVCNYYFYVVLNTVVILYNPYFLLPRLLLQSGP